MGKILSVSEIDKILGKRSTMEERKAFRNAADNHNFVKSNRDDGVVRNPYAVALESLSQHSHNPSERHSYARNKALFDKWEANHAAEQAREDTRLRMETHDEYQKANAHFVEIINNFETKSAEDVVDKEACYSALDAYLDGNDEALSHYYSYARSLTDRRLEESDKELAEIRKTDENNHYERLRVEAENSKLRAKSMPQSPPAELGDSDA